MTITIPLTQRAQTCTTHVGGEPMVFHCHHYNTFLQRSIQDASYIRSAPFLIGAAAEVAYNQLSSAFRDAGISEPRARQELAAELYRWAGFGTVSFDGVDEKGGMVETGNSHYALAWKAKFGHADHPICYFASGWLAGALAAVYDRAPDTYSVRHDACMAAGGPVCRFEVHDDGANHQVFRSVGEGRTTGTFQPGDAEAGNVDYQGIYDALTGMQIVGDENGSIPAFGVYLTRHYANYYNRISFETLRGLVDMFGDEGVAAAHPMFVEAGHVCAFNTFGGIMTSTEWDALIKPMLKTREDWVHGMVAAVNALGWGRWQVKDLSSEGATFVVHDDYESSGYLAMYGKSSHPISYLAEGAAAGIMNLVYRGEVQSKPSFTPEFYDHLFKDVGNYSAKPVESRAMGDAVTSFRVAAE